MDSDNFCYSYHNKLSSARISTKLQQLAEEYFDFNFSDYWLIRDDRVCDGSLVAHSPSESDLVHHNATIYYYNCTDHAGNFEMIMESVATLHQYQVFNLTITKLVVRSMHCK